MAGKFYLTLLINRKHEKIAQIYAVNIMLQVQYLYVKYNTLESNIQYNKMYFSIWKITDKSTVAVRGNVYIQLHIHYSYSSYPFVLCCT